MAELRKSEVITVNANSEPMSVSKMVDLLGLKPTEFCTFNLNGQKTTCKKFSGDEFAAGLPEPDENGNISFEAIQKHLADLRARVLEAPCVITGEISEEEKLAIRKAAEKAHPGYSVKTVYVPLKRVPPLAAVTELKKFAIANGAKNFFRITGALKTVCK